MRHPAFSHTPVQTKTLIMLAKKVYDKKSHPVLELVRQFSPGSKIQK